MVQLHTEGPISTEVTYNGYFSQSISRPDCCRLHCSYLLCSIRDYLSHDDFPFVYANGFHLIRVYRWSFCRWREDSELVSGRRMAASPHTMGIHHDDAVRSSSIPSVGF